MQISSADFTAILELAVSEAIKGERERILNAIKSDAVTSTQIDITVLNYLVGMLEL